MKRENKTTENKGRTRTDEKDACTSERNDCNMDNRKNENNRRNDNDRDNTENDRRSNK